MFLSQHIEIHLRVTQLCRLRGWMFVKSAFVRMPSGCIVFPRDFRGSLNPQVLHKCDAAFLPLCVKLSSANPSPTRSSLRGSSEWSLQGQDHMLRVWILVFQQGLSRVSQQRSTYLEKMNVLRCVFVSSYLQWWINGLMWECAFPEIEALEASQVCS